MGNKKVPSFIDFIDYIELPLINLLEQKKVYEIMTIVPRNECREHLLKRVKNINEKLKDNG